MKRIFIILAIINLSHLAHGICKKQNAQEPVVTNGDFPWEQSLSQLEAKHLEIYKSGKRLPDRSYTHGENIFLPSKLLSTFAGHDVTLELPLEFSEIVASHISSAIRAGYAKQVIYSDMGHAHIFAAKEVLQQMKLLRLDPDSPEYYERVISHPSTKFLYHALEQGKDDEHDFSEEFAFRKAHRNILGAMDGSISSLGDHPEYNNVHTVRQIKGYSQLFSLYFSASKDGCYNYDRNGRREKFDISTSRPAK